MTKAPDLCQQCGGPIPEFAIQPCLDCLEALHPNTPAEVDAEVREPRRSFDRDRDIDRAGWRRVRRGGARW